MALLELAKGSLETLISYPTDAFKIVLESDFNVTDPSRILELSIGGHMQRLS